MERQRNIYVAGNFIVEQHIDTQTQYIGASISNSTTYNVQGDYIAGDKHVGAHIDNVSPGAIGAQTNKNEN